MEQTRLKLGIVPLADCAPLVVAKERGFFAEQGLDVDLSREPSWANIRDKVAVGTLDGAQMLAPMPLSMTLGLGGIRQPMVTGLALNLGGNTITLSAGLCLRMEAKGGLTAQALKQVIADDAALGRPPMAFAVVYPFAPHNYELRYWLASGGIDPDRDVRLMVVPPPQMVGYLSAGNIQGFCVGEPWGSLAANMELGRVVATSADIFGGRIEKVLGVTRALAENRPDTHLALIKAILAAAQWCEANLDETAEIIAQPAYVNVPAECIRQGLDRMVLHAQAANFPWVSQAMWYLTQMQRWRQLGLNLDVSNVAAQVYRPDIFRLAAQDLKIAYPLVDSKTEGEHDQPWTLTQASQPIPMGPDHFLDGARFDPLHMTASQAQGLG